MSVSCLRRLISLGTVFLLGGAGTARAAERTTLSIEELAPERPRYSQALSFVVRLARSEDGSAVAGTACTPACSVVVEIGPANAPSNDPNATFLVNAQGFVTDPEGAASIRIPLVDGLFDDAVFAADPQGAAFILRAFFRGSGAGAALDNPDCAPSGAPVLNGDLCPSEATAPVSIFTETADIVLGAGLDGALGDTLTVAAELKDPNGDASFNGDDVDGSGPVLLVDREVTFFFDANNNGRPDAGNGELIGTATTNTAGVASISLPLEPEFGVRAGTYEQGVHAEFGGDGLYGVARASTALIVRPADVDPTRTILEIDPDEIPADGFSKSKLRVRLVDVYNNPLDEESEPHEVVLATDLGVLVDAPALDPDTGTYTQELQAQRKAGTATITVTVDGVTATTGTVEIIGGGGCACGSASHTAGAGAFLLGIGLFDLARRRRTQARGPRP